MLASLLIVPIALGQIAPTTAQSSLDGPSIVARISPAVVLIKGETSTGTILGSGLILSRDGKVATNLHVIRDLKTAGVQLASGEIFDAVSVLAFDDRKDLAIIKLAGFDLPFVELGNSNEVRSGERVVAIGSPRGLQGTVTTGVVSAVRDDPAGAGFKLIQTDASVNPGNSGGPLLNDRAQAIGVITSKLRGSEGLNFAVPIN
jgi:S1-C subfamily serine protease